MDMSRGGALAAHLAGGVLAAAYPMREVRRAVADCGKSSQRESKLLAETTTFAVIGLAMLMDVSTQEVLNTISAGLAWSGAGSRRRVAGKSAFALARKRLGAGPLRLLWERSARPLARPGDRGCFYRKLRLVAIDGTSLDVADTAANLAHFGKPHSGGASPAAFPQLSLVGLAEVGTHTLFAAATGPCATSELTLAEAILPSLEKGMLCLADRFFPSFDLWKKASATGAHLAWRVRDDRLLPRERELADGSFLSTIYASQKDRAAKRDGIRVRVVEYTVESGKKTGRFRLMTTLLSPDEAPAAELAALYPERWEIEGLFDELKTHLRGGSVVLRSKTPELVEQEVYGLLLAHRAVRELMHRAACEAGEDPDRISFTHTVNIVRRKLAAAPALSPSEGRKVPARHR